jgi:hypothetical protein
VVAVPTAAPTVYEQLYVVVVVLLPLVVVCVAGQVRLPWSLDGTLAADA